MPILRLVMFLTTTLWVLLLPTLTPPKLRVEGVSEICCAPARAGKSVMHKDKKTGKPCFEPKLFTAYTFSCAQPGRDGGLVLRLSRGRFFTKRSAGSDS